MKRVLPFQATTSPRRETDKASPKVAHRSAARDATPKSAEDDSPASGKESPSSPRVLLVDDDENTRFVLNCILVENGYSISEAESGQTFRQAMLQPAPDLILLDLKLPDANGLDLLKLIRQEWPGAETIILTGFAAVDTALKAVKLGAYDYLSKPLDCKKLLTTIQRALERRRLKLESERLRREEIERHRQLDLLRSTAISSNQAFSVAEVADKTLKQFCDFIGWPVGHLALFSPISDDHPGSKSFWNLSQNRNYSVFCRVTDDGSTNLYKDWIGQEGEAADVKWSEDVTKEPGFLRWHAARACGLKKGLTAPIVCSGAIVGALEFYAGAVPPPTRNQRVAAAQVAAQISCVLDRETAQLALQATRAEIAAEVLEQNRTINRLRDSLNREVHQQLNLLESVEFEMRAPISNMMSSALDLQRTPGKRSAGYSAAHAETILSQSHRLRRMIENVIDLRQLESGGVDLTAELVNLRALCESAVTEARRLAVSKDIEIRLHVDDSPTSVKADEKRLLQLLSHLLTNAIKFTPRRGKVSLSVCRATVGNALALVVRDSGVGVREMDQERIYEPFVRLDSSEGGEMPGSGLGLALAQQIARLHGGSIQLKSAPNEGSEFRVILPCDLGT